MALLGDNANTTAQGAMRPPKLREKLSSLVRRKGSTKSRSQLTTATTTTTTATTTRRSEDLYSVRTSNGAPLLDVNLERTRSYRLAEGWLEDESKKSPSSPSKRRHGQGGAGDPDRKPEKEAEDLRRQTKTPIAAMFSKSTDQLASTLETISFRKPLQSVSASTTNLPAATDGNTSSVKATQQGPQVSTAKVPVPEPEPQPIRISLHHSIVEEPVVTTPKVSQVPQSRGRAMQSSWGIRAVANELFDEGPQRHSIRQVGLLRSVGDNTTGLRVSGGGNGNGNGGGSAVGDSAKRFSAPSISSPVPVPVPEPTINKAAYSTAMSRGSSVNTPTAAPPRSSLNLENQRQWQPPTSAPRTSQDGGIRPPPQRTLSNRPPLTSSRLSWIRDLENKSSSSSSSSSSAPEIQRLKKNVGVAGKLAMFEQIQKQTAPLPPAFISRSNSRASSRSRMSSAAFTDPIQHADGASGRPLSYVSTARTSMDSTRESMSISNRNSGVMAYYDQGFREKMEGVAGGWAKKLEKLAGGGKKESDEEEKTTDQSSESSVKAGSPTEVTAANAKAEEEAREEWKAPVQLPFLDDITGANKKEDGNAEEEGKKAKVDQPSSEEAPMLADSKTEPEVTMGAEEGKAPVDLSSLTELRASSKDEDVADKSGVVEEVEKAPEQESAVVEEGEVEKAAPADVQTVSEAEPSEETGAVENEQGQNESVLLPSPAEVQALGEKPAEESGAVKEEKENDSLPSPLAADEQVGSGIEEPVPAEQIVAVEKPQE